MLPCAAAAQRTHTKPRSNTYLYPFCIAKALPHSPDNVLPKIVVIEATALAHQAPIRAQYERPRRHLAVWPGGSLNFFRRKPGKEKTLTTSSSSQTQTGGGWLPVPWGAARDRMPKRRPQRAPAYAHGVAGVSAGLASTYLCYPLDLISTRLQSSDGSRRPSLLGVIRGVFAREGVRGFYGGLSANLIGSGCGWGLYFMSYEQAKSFIRQTSSSQSVGHAGHFAAAAAAGAWTCTLTNPIWVIKTRMQLQGGLGDGNSRVYNGVFDAARKIATDEGIRGLTRGLGPSLIMVSHPSLQFMAYEALKDYARERRALSGPTTLGGIFERLLIRGDSDAKAYRTRDAQELGAFEFVICAALSKMFASVVTYPYQVVRTRLQKIPNRGTIREYSGIVDTARKIFRHEGVNGFYKGLNANLMRAVPASCINFLVYENVWRLLVAGGREPT